MNQTLWNNIVRKSRSVVRKKTQQSIFDEMADLPYSNDPPQVGDLFVTKNWNPNFLTFQHAGLIYETDQTPWTIIDCTPRKGCSVRPLNVKRYSGKTLYLVRLPDTLPNREEIIREGLSMAKYLIEHQRVRYINMSRYNVAQFVRILVGKCMGQVGWDELKSYITRFLAPYLEKKPFSDKIYMTFCSRFVLIIYQLAAWHVWTMRNIPVHMIARMMEEYFAFQPQHCRPWHILMLSKGIHPWKITKIRL